MLEADRISSALFYGPPGTGKTSLAYIIAAATDAHFEPLHATAAGVKELRQLLSEARDRLDAHNRRTILFVDELHRFNRAQQDVLLSDVEAGTIILIGATTENPFFAVNAPLISRSLIFQFEELSAEDIKRLLHRALGDTDRGLGKHRATLTSEAADHFANNCGGDARRALNALEIAVLSQAERSAAGDQVVVDLDAAADSIQRKVIRHDATGDAHYDTVSALIKSIRGSDPDAAVYWLARMFEAGEDPRFIARRIVISAAEDIGNADPRGLLVAQAAAEATRMVGLPECQLPLAQAAIYLACAPKSNASAKAIWSAAEDVRSGTVVPVPRHLRSTGYAGAVQLGAGQGYQYPHDSPDAIVSQDYLGVDKVYYTPSDRGAEARIREYLAFVRRKTGESPRD
jgi:putative ATPase